MKVYQESCKNCLLSKDRIVSPKAAKDIIAKCQRTQSHFICHKASIDGEDICCHTFYEKLGGYSQLIRIMERLNAIQFVPQTDNTKLPSYSELNTKK